MAIFRPAIGGTSVSDFIPLFGGTQNTQCITEVSPNLLNV